MVPSFDRFDLLTIKHKIRDVARIPKKKIGTRTVMASQTFIEGLPI